MCSNCFIFVSNFNITVDGGCCRRSRAFLQNPSTQSILSTQSDSMWRNTTTVIFNYPFGFHAVEYNHPVNFIFPVEFNVVESNHPVNFIYPVGFNLVDSNHPVNFSYPFRLRDYVQRTSYNVQSHIVYYYSFISLSRCGKKSNLTLHLFFQTFADVAKDGIFFPYFILTICIQN